LPHLAWIKRHTRYDSVTTALMARGAEATGSMRMAEKPAEQNRKNRLIVFEDAGHGMIERFGVVRREIDRWFARHLE